MKIAYIDSFAGVSGDMLLGSLVDSGWPVDELSALVEKMGLKEEVNIKQSRVLRRGASGLKLSVHTKEHHAHRHLSHILNCIDRVDLPVTTKEKAKAVFRCLAEAEAEVHGVSVEEVHFHEVGAADAIVDIVGVCQGLYALGVEKVYYSPVRVGSGHVDCAHGRLPVPAPATARLLQGMNVFGGDVQGEWATPTGTALLKTLATGVDSMPPMKSLSIGVGAGDADPQFSNLLRMFIGEIEDGGISSNDDVIVIDATIDDISGEYYPFIMEKLLKLPVCDVFLTPVIMKKGRPGHSITVLVDSNLVDNALEVLFRESSTYGVRIRQSKRIVLGREIITVPWQNRNIHVKTGYWRGKLVQVSPEYEDCKLAAEENNLELRSVYYEVLSLAKNLLHKEGSI